MVLTMAYASNGARTSSGFFAVMLRIYNVDAVTLRAPVQLWMRAFGAVGMCLGTLLCGFRLVPVTGLCRLLLACHLGTS